MVLFFRIKPILGKETPARLSWNTDAAAVGVAGKFYEGATAVVPPESDNVATNERIELDKYIDAFLEGFDVNILAYGQTGSGKTHTIIGPPGFMEKAGKGAFGTETHPSYGFFPRAVMKLVDRVRELNSQALSTEKGVRFYLFASAVELQYETPMDLLFGKCPCFLDSNVKPAVLYGQTEVPLGSREDVLRVFAGLATRNTVATKLNDSSSRSQCFMTLTLHRFFEEGENLLEGVSSAASTGRAVGGTGPSIRSSRMQFVDLAGSERLTDAHEFNQNVNLRNYTSTSKDQMNLWNGLATNYGLGMLSQCIRDIAKVKDPLRHSFRQYKVQVVSLLQESIVGKAHTCLLVCLNQGAQNDAQSHNAIDFGVTFSHLRIRPVLNVSRSLSVLVSKLKQEVGDQEEGLKRKLASENVRNVRNARLRWARQMLNMLERPVSTSSGVGSGTEGQRRPDAGDAAIGPPLSLSLPDSIALRYPLRGTWDSISAATTRYTNELDMREYDSKGLRGQREESSSEMRQLGKAVKENRRYVTMQSVEEITIDGSRYGSVAGLRILVHRAKGAHGGGGGSQTPSRALIYFHGGGVVYFSARDYSSSGLMARYAVDNNLVVFNVDYRLAPETKVPGQILDGYAAIKHVHTHASKYGVDPDRICVAGESGGGYVAVGACMHLSRSGEAGLVRLLLAVSPQTSPMFHAHSAQELARVQSECRLDLQRNFFNRCTKYMKPESRKQSSRGAAPGAAHEARGSFRDAYLFPNLMSARDAQGMPKCVIMTQEFDVLRIASQELAIKLQREGRLCELVIHPGLTHVWYVDFSHKKSSMFFRETKRILDEYL